MLNYIIRRLFAGIVTIWAASIISFIVIQLPPGDYVTTYVAALQSTGTMVNSEQADAIREQYGLNQPMYMQYIKWMKLMLQGNFGMAMEYNQPVSVVIGDRMTMTIVVSLGAVLLIWALALPIGIYSAVRQYSVVGLAQNLGLHQAPAAACCDHWPGWHGGSDAHYARQSAR